MYIYMYILFLSRNAYTLFIMDNMDSARLLDSGRLDLKKLGEMWKSLSESDRDVGTACFHLWHVYGS